MDHMLWLELWTNPVESRQETTWTLREDQGMMAQVGNLLMGWEDDPVGKVLVLQV